MGGGFESVAEFLQPEVAAEWSWRMRARCLGLWAQYDFFPERGKSADAAKKLCFGCSVREDCLTYALQGNEREGVLGGTTEKERRPLLRRVVAGESIADVVASTVPRVRLGWTPSSEASARYGQWLMSRKAAA